MSISYVKPARPAPVAVPASTQVRNARYWLDQYRRLTSEIQRALVLNKDPMRKEQIDTRGLYNQRANAVAQMADALEALL